MARPVLAARLEGELETAFPEGRPEGSDWAGEHRATGTAGPVLLVADADMLSDRDWVQQRRILGATIPQAFANDGDFLLNMVEQMADALRARVAGFEFALSSYDAAPRGWTADDLTEPGSAG